MDWSSVTDWLVDHGIRIAIVIAVAVIFYIIMRNTIRRATKAMLAQTMKDMPQEEKQKREDTLTWLFYTTCKVTITIVALFVILAEVGINIGALLAGFGVIGIAVAFAAQSFIKDLIAGFVIAIENQFNIGDVVDVGGKTGVVEAMNIRRTTLRDLDGVHHVVPNGEIRITSNYTKVWARAHLNIGIAYKEDADQVMAVLRRTWEEMAAEPAWGPSIISKTPSILRLNEFGDSAVVIKLVGDTRAMHQWNVMAEFRRRIKRLFDEKGIEIPWPHTKVYFGEEPKPEEKGKGEVGNFTSLEAGAQIVPPSAEDMGE